MKKTTVSDAAGIVANMFSAMGVALKNARLKAVRAFDSSATALALKNLRANIPYLKNSVVGTFFLTFGIYSTLISVFRFSFAAHGSVSDVLISVFAAIIALPFLFSRGTVGMLFTLSETGKMIAEAIGMRLHLSFAAPSIGRVNVAFLAGVIFGSLTFVFSPLQVLSLIVSLVVAGVIFTFPEASALLMAIFLPLGKGDLLSFIAVCGTVAFVIKLFRGKRSVSFHHHRAAVLLLMAIILVSELFSGNLKFSLVMLVFFLLSASDGYGERAEKVSAVAVAVYGGVSALYMTLACISSFGNIKADLSVFHVPAIALCAAALIPLGASFVLSKTGLPVQTAFLCTLSLTGFLAYNGYFMYIIASVASFIVFLFFFRRRASYGVFALACAAYSVWVWLGGSNRAAVDHLMNFLKELGIAYEEGAMFILVGDRVGNGFVDSESFYGALVSGIGVIGAVILASAICMLFGYILRKKYGKGSDRSSATYMRAWAPASSIIVLLICGLGINIWAYDGVYALFWILMGVSSSVAVDAESKAKRASMEYITVSDKTKAEIAL